MGLNVAVLANLKKNAPQYDGHARRRLGRPGFRHHGQRHRRRAGSGGHRATFLEGNLSLVETLPRLKPDICFNICEGHWGDIRESHVPAILEMLRIPYTGSGVLTLALTLDKPMTKRVLAFHELPTPAFQVFERADEPLDADLTLPAVRQAQPRRHRHGRQRRVHRAHGRRSCARNWLDAIGPLPPADPGGALHPRPRGDGGLRRQPDAARGAARAGR